VDLLFVSHPPPVDLFLVLHPLPVDLQQKIAPLAEDTKQEIAPLAEDTKQKIIPLAEDAKQTIFFNFKTPYIPLIQVCFNYLWKYDILPSFVFLFCGGFMPLINSHIVSGPD
jgi:hypothetical protein